MEKLQIDKSQLRTVESALDLLQQLQICIDKNPKCVHPSVKKAIDSSEDELSAFVTIAKDKGFILDVNNSEVLQREKEGLLDKSVEYEYTIEKDIHNGEFEISISPKNEDESEASDFPLEFSNYLDKEEAEADVEWLQMLGYSLEER